MIKLIWLLLMTSIVSIPEVHSQSAPAVPMPTASASVGSGSHRVIPTNSIRQATDVLLDGISVTNLVSTEEPGDRLVIYGTVFGLDGKTPVTNATLRIYQTDVSGLYSPNAKDDSNPRLQASLRTGPGGGYEVRTIMPGRYPDGKTPAHVHLVVNAPGFPVQDATFLLAGDPALTAEDYERHGDGTFSYIRPAKLSADGILRCRRDILLRR